MEKLPFSPRNYTREPEVPGAERLGEVTSAKLNKGFDVNDANHPPKRPEVIGSSVAQRPNDLWTCSLNVGTIHQCGLRHGVELVNDRKMKNPANAMADRVLYEALNLGLSFFEEPAGELTSRAEVDCR